MPSNNSEFLWFKLNRNFFKLPYDLFVLAVYVCPENSSYAGKSGDIFQLIESDIAKYSQQGKCLVFGDFNGRTRNEPDYCVNDDVLSLYLPPDGSSLTDIPLIRNNCDISDVDKNGKQLLELCKGSGLRIMNGRIFGDSLGYHTCFSKTGNLSTIDYFLCSPEILDTSRFLRVEAPSTDSIHCLLTLSISTKLFSTIPIPNEHLHMEDISNFSWDSFSQQRFEEVVARHASTFDVPNTLCNPTPDSVDDIIKKIQHFYHTCAVDANLRRERPKSRKNTVMKNKNKKWYTNSLALLKKDINRMANQLRLHPYDKAKLVQFHYKKKTYNKLVKDTKRKYEQNLVSQLQSLEINQPQTFWRIYKQLKNLDDVAKENPICPSEWVDHFSSLLNSIQTIPEDLKSHVKQSLLCKSIPTFNELNFRITASELISAAQSLKMGKSPGVDGITNEMIKTSLPYLNNHLLNTFNILLSNGIFPKSWSMNTLTPLHKKGSLHLTQNYRGIAVSNCIAKLFLNYNPQSPEVICWSKLPYTSQPNWI